jgi:hypothetical protein
VLTDRRWRLVPHRGGGHITTVIEEAEADPIEQAVATLWHEFDEAVALLMLTVDLFDEAQRTGGQINVPNLRKALGKKIQPAIRARDEALAIQPDADEPA